MIQPDGRASLATRERYLKRRRAGRLGDRGVVALWLGFGALVSWLAIAGLVCTIIGFVVMFFTQNQGYGGLFAP